MGDFKKAVDVVIKNFGERLGRSPPFSDQSPIRKSFKCPSASPKMKWQPTPVFLPGESQGRGSRVGCRLWGHTESDTTEVI